MYHENKRFISFAKLKQWTTFQLLSGILFDYYIQQKADGLTGEKAKEKKNIESG